MTRPKEDRDEKQVAVWLRADIKEALAEAAARENRSQKAVLEAALTLYLSPKSDQPAT